MKLLPVSPALLACGALTLPKASNNRVQVDAFSLQVPLSATRRAVFSSTASTTSRLNESPPSTETFTDVQEAVQELITGDGTRDQSSTNDSRQEEKEEEEQNYDDALEVYNDCPVAGTTKEELLEDIQGVMEGIEEEESSSNEKGTGSLINDINSKLSHVPDKSLSDKPHSVEEAAISASLYMNPLTEKIAQNVKITWEPEVAEMLHNLEKASNPNRPFLVGIVGIPGSGKSTSAEVLQAILGEDRAIVMPHDGYHIPLAELAELPNAADAIYRRGAPDTFNPRALKEALTRIAGYDRIVGVDSNGNNDGDDGDDAYSQVSMPGFDHSKGDPTPDQHTFQRDRHKIVLCEGLYLLHDDHGWEDIKSFFDWTIYIDADVDACVERLKERNKCIPGYTPEEIEIRCDVVDRVNAITAREGAYKYASQIVKSGASS